MSELDKLYTNSGILGWLNAPRQEHRQGFSVVTDPNKDAVNKYLKDASTSIATGTIGITSAFTGKVLTRKAIDKIEKEFGNDALVKAIFPSRYEQHVPDYFARQIVPLIKSSKNNKELIGSLKELFVKTKMKAANPKKDVSEEFLNAFGERGIEQLVKRNNEQADWIAEMIRDLQ